MSAAPPQEAKSARAALRARRARRGLRFTREGRVFVLTTLGVGAAAVNTGNNLLYLVLGLMLSLIVLSGVLSDLVLWGVRVRRTLPTRAFAGSPCVIELALANEKRWLPSFSIEVEDQAESEPTDRRCYYLKIAPRAEQVAAYRRTPARRGPLVLSRFRLSTRYPFGLFEKWRLIEDRAELLVYPALVPVAMPELPSAARADERAAPRPGHGTEVAGLREYREGDEARAIHWRRSAALGRIVVRERERESGARFTIVLDELRPASDAIAGSGAANAASGAGAAGTGPQPTPWHAAFEEAVSRAASIAERALRGGATVDVRTRAASSPLALGGSPPDPILRFLARLAPIDRASYPGAEVPSLPVPRGESVRVIPGLPTEARSPGRAGAVGAS